LPGRFYSSSPRWRFGPDLSVIIDGRGSEASGDMDEVACDIESKVGRGFRGDPGGRLGTTGMSGFTTVLGRPGRCSDKVVVPESFAFFGWTPTLSQWVVRGRDVLESINYLLFEMRFV